jgi:hypothetical protein
MKVAEKDQQLISLIHTPSLTIVLMRTFIFPNRKLDPPYYFQLFVNV